MQGYRSTCRAVALALGSLWLVACASVPFDYPRDASAYIPVSADTQLGELAQQWHEAHGDQGGFFGMGSGVDALGARLKLLELAQESVDAQYFIVKNDRAGTLFSAGLLAAADRGVRVRLLVDDIFSPGVDEAFTLLATHPNVEIRLFNPLPRQAIKYLGFLTDFKRANRRMHNKSFTVDGAFSIVGGRNIGEEYFEIKQDAKFDDYEVLMLGTVVEEVQQGFDLFWNSDLAVPMEAFGAQVDVAELDRWREAIDRQLSGQRYGLYAGAMDSALLQQISSGDLKPIIADATLVTDTPDKLHAAVGDRDQAVLAVEVGRRFREATKEVLVVTPYYIPQDYGVAVVEELLERGVRVRIVTNSLASTNHVPVHSGYARYRKRLLQAGAEFYEIRVDAVHDDSPWGHRPETVTLHSKATVIDRQTIFIGSLNFDPRSIMINTEMGLFIESPEAGEAFAQGLESELQRVAWRVELDEGGKLRWHYDYDGLQEVADSEPQAGWWRRFQVGFYRMLPIENQL